MLVEVVLLKLARLARVLVGVRRGAAATVQVAVSFFLVSACTQVARVGLTFGVVVVAPPRGK